MTTFTWLVVAGAVTASVALVCAIVYFAIVWSPKNPVPTDDWVMTPIRRKVVVPKGPPQRYEAKTSDPHLTWSQADVDAVRREYLTSQLSESDQPSVAARRASLLDTQFADALRKVADAVGDDTEYVVVVSGIIAVGYINSEGKPVRIARLVTSAEEKLLAEHPDLLSHPSALFNILSAENVV